MPLYFYNIDDGHTTIDNVGSEHPDLQSARQEALVTSGETLLDGGSLGQPWRLWVTDQPGGVDKTLFTLRSSATEGDGQP